MWMRADIEPVSRMEFGRAEMVKENERPNHSRARRGQRAPYGEVAEVNSPRHDHLVDGVALIGIACGRILAGEKTHPSLLCLAPSSL
jgi:hypothetical protein